MALILKSLVVLGFLSVELGLARKIETNAVEDVSFLLEPIVAKYNAPALGGLFMDENGTVRIGTWGTRKRWSGVNVTTDDLWHLGSCTKAMTATLVAIFVENGNVSWETTVGSIFDDLDLRPEFDSVNFLHLLSHTAGIPGNPDWTGLSESAPTLVEQRLNTVKALNDIVDPIPAPGTVTVYSNWGIVVAAAMLERVTGQSYEELMSAHVFGPLGMASVGYGPTSVPGETNQPWAHYPIGNTSIPVHSDNPLVMSPAGTVHCSLEDWAKFVLDHLRGELGIPGLLTVESYTRLHTAAFNPLYALGWLNGFESWAEGLTIWHTGSNGINYTKMVIDRTGRVACIASCNQGANSELNMYSAINEVLNVMATYDDNATKQT